MSKKVPQYYGKLGKEIRISPKSLVSIFADVEGGYAELVLYVGEESCVVKMSIPFYEKVLEGVEVKTTTVVDFKNNSFITNKKK